MPRPRKKIATEETASVQAAPEPVMSVSRARSRRMSTPAFVGVFIFMTIIVVSTAILIGRSDSGQIDVTATIKDANERNRELYGDDAVQVNTVREELRNLPNGGLLPQENQPADPPPPPTDTASITDSNATTTPEAGDEAENETEEAGTSESTEGEGEPAADTNTTDTQNGGQ